MLSGIDVSITNIMTYLVKGLYFTTLKMCVSMIPISNYMYLYLLGTAVN